MFYFQAQEKKMVTEQEASPGFSKNINGWQAHGKPNIKPMTSPTDGSKPSKPQILKKKKKKKNLT